MKVNDTVPVMIGAHVVAQAQVKSVDTTESTATLVVPATLVVMGIRTELTDLPGSEQETEHIITGLEPNEVDDAAASESASASESADAADVETDNASASVDASTSADASHVESVVTSETTSD